MMAEKELIGEIRKLRQIEPSQDWVSLTKSQILGQDLNVDVRRQHFLFFPVLRPIYISLILIFVLFGLFGFSQNSLPGDFLYPLKKIVEKSQAVFVSEEELPKVQLELANKRLEELTKIAETNQVKKLAPALEEYQASLVKATKNLTKMAATTSDPVAMKKIAKETQKLEEAKEKLEKIYGIAGLEIEEELNPTKVVVEWLIKDLEKRTLTEEEQLIFEEAKEDFEKGDYNSALEKILKM